MQIEADAVIPFPRESVFRTYRDDLPALIEFLPHVRRIEALGREEIPRGVQTLYTWHGGGDIPIPVQRGLGDNTFRWDERTLWDEQAWSCDWTIETRAFHDAVRCSGRHTFVALGERTRLEIEGSMSFDLAAIKALPSFLAGGLANTVEQFVSRQITANLLSVSDALTRYLESRTQT
jgi:hypothetical protein